MSFVNPLTVYFMLEELQKNNHKSVVHTLGSSQVGRIMTQYFSENGVDVISIVRKKEQIEQLQKEVGAKYVLNSSDENFDQQLKELTQKLGTKYCFDAIGGEFSGRVLKNMP